MALEIKSGQFFATQSRSNAQSAMTVEAVVQLYSGTENPTIFAKPRYADWREPFLIYRLGFEGTSGVPIFQVLLEGDTEVTGVRGANPIPLNTTCHISGTYDGKHLRIYVDGEEKGVVERPGVLVEGTEPDVMGARSATDAGWYYSGLFFEVRQFHRARTAAEVRAWALRPLPPPGGESCVGLWQSWEAFTESVKPRGGDPGLSWGASIAPPPVHLRGGGGMNPVSGDDLRTFAAAAQAQFGPVPERHPVRIYAISGDVLCAVMGHPWVSDNVFGNAPLDDYLRPLSELPLDRFKHLDRIRSLAETLYHFHGMEGFEDRLTDLRREAIEAVVGELEGAAMLYKAGVPFQFVRASGVPGRDFDVRVRLPERPVINCEMKCKMESTGLSEASIINTLNRSRKQLPPGEPGLVFVKIPESWATGEDAGNVLNSAITTFLRNTSRIGALLFHWEVWQLLPQGPALRMTLSRPEFNEQSPFVAPIRDCLSRLRSGPRGERWLSFIELMS